MTRQRNYRGLFEREPWLKHHDWSQNQVTASVSESKSVWKSLSSNYEMNLQKNHVRNQLAKAHVCPATMIWWHQLHQIRTPQSASQKVFQIADQFQFFSCKSMRSPSSLHHIAASSFFLFFSFFVGCFCGFVFWVLFDSFCSFWFFLFFFYIFFLFFCSSYFSSF